MARGYNYLTRRGRGTKRFRSNSNAVSRMTRRRTAFGRGVHSGQGVTVQHDERRIYSKRTMPRRRKRVWKRFSRKVNAVAEKDLGSRTVVFNVPVNNSNTNPANQVLLSLALYSGKNTSFSYLNDLAQISVYENVGDPTSNAGINISDTTKFIFKSAVLDLTFRNTSTVNVGGVQTPDSRGKMEVDVYEIISSKEWTDSSTNYGDIGALFTRGADITKKLNNAGTAIDLGLRGVTPWDLPAALSYFRLKILKKTKYFVNNGDTFTYQVRDPKRRVMIQERLEKIPGGNVPRWSRYVLFIAKLVPGNTVGTASGEWTESITIGVTRKYLYKVEGANDDRHRYAVL